MEILDNKKVLILSPAGDESIFRNWTTDGQPWELVLLYYDSCSTTARLFSQHEQVSRVVEKKGFKWHLIHEFITRNREFIDGFDYIWFPDDDVDMFPEDIAKFININVKHDLLLSQPALAGFGSHEITYPRPANVLRYTNFVEVMAPMVKVSELDRILDTFIAGDSSWGLDWVWPAIIGTKERKVAIVDAVVMVHTRPVNSRVLYKKLTTDPVLDVAHVLDRYAPGLIREYKCYGGVPRRGKSGIEDHRRWSSALFPSGKKPDSEIGEPRAILLSGFHRSGTSLAAQMLHLSGIPLALNSFNANISNVDGHFEDLEAMKIHDRFLAHQQTSWRYAGEQPLLRNEGQYLQFRDYISKRESDNQSSDLWALKDPRASLFLDSWKASMWGHGRFVFMYRHWSACIQSLYLRHSREIAHNLPTGQELADHLVFWQQPDLAARMWLSYNKAILKFVGENSEISLLVPQAALMEGFDLIRAINDKFAVKVPALESSPVKPGLTSATVDDTVVRGLSAELVIELDRVYRELAGLSDAPFAYVVPPVRAREVDEGLNPYLQQYREAVEDQGHSQSDEGDADDSVEIRQLLKEMDSLEFDEILARLNASRAGTSGDLAKLALPVAIRLQKLRPFHLMTHSWLGRLYERQFKLSKAEFHYQRAIILNPSSPWGFVHLANIYVQTERYQEAEYFYKKAIALKPDFAVLSFKLGSLYLKQGLYEQASRHLSRATKLDDKKAAFQLALIDCYLKQQDQVRALKIAEIFWSKNKDIALGRKLHSISLEMKSKDSKRVYDEVIKTHINRDRVGEWLQEQAVNFGEFEDGESLECLFAYLEDHWKLISTED